jgi:hypothetical protein
MVQGLQDTVQLLDDQIKAAECMCFELAQLLLEVRASLKSASLVDRAYAPWPVDGARSGRAVNSILRDGIASVGVSRTSR